MVLSRLSWLCLSFSIDTGTKSWFLLRRYSIKLCDSRFHVQDNGIRSFASSRSIKQTALAGGPRPLGNNRGKRWATNIRSVLDPDLVLSRYRELRKSSVDLWCLSFHTPSLLCVHDSGSNSDLQRGIFGGERGRNTRRIHRFKNSQRQPRVQYRRIYWDGLQIFPRTSTWESFQNDWWRELRKES